MNYAKRLIYPRQLTRHKSRVTFLLGISLISDQVLIQAEFISNPVEILFVLICALLIKVKEDSQTHTSYPGTNKILKKNYSKDNKKNLTS